MTIRKDYSGIKFGHLTLIEYQKAGGAGVGAIWRARCDCGEEREVVARAVTHGRIRSCGKCQLSRDPNGAKQITLRGAHRQLYLRYMKKAMARGVEWSLSPEQFVDMVGQCCLYCGAKPGQRIKRGDIVYSGIERMRMQEGYTPSNSAACCPACRLLKGNLNAVRFLEIVQSIAHHLDSLQ